MYNALSERFPSSLPIPFSLRLYGATLFVQLRGLGACTFGCDWGGAATQTFAPGGKYPRAATARAGHSFVGFRDFRGQSVLPLS